MRPSLLDPLFATAARLPGIGPKTATLLDRLLAKDAGEARVLDLLFHLPYAAIDRRNRPKIVDAPLDAIVTLAKSRPSSTGRRVPAPRRPTRSWSRTTPATSSSSSPIIIGSKRARMAPLEPLYPSTEGLFQKTLGRAINAALAKIPALPEWHDRTALNTPALPAFAAALWVVHRPSTPESIAPEAPARMRLAFDELLASQLALALMRAKIRRAPGRTSQGDGESERRLPRRSLLH
jgi:ATP-dependent DNA helicase RecG